jgi:hypothetical protein
MNDDFQSTISVRAGRERQGAALTAAGNSAHLRIIEKNFT